jgi:hypothetical protein
MLRSWWMLVEIKITNHPGHFDEIVYSYKYVILISLAVEK